MRRFGQSFGVRNVECLLAQLILQIDLNEMKKRCCCWVPAQICATDMEPTCLPSKKVCFHVLAFCSKSIYKINVDSRHFHIVACRARVDNATAMMETLYSIPVDPRVEFGAEEVVLGRSAHARHLSCGPRK